ncbi:MAG: sensor histidine kinase [Flavobacteriaceae bacterium]
MPQERTFNELLRDKSALVLRVNYFTSIFSVLFGLVCYFLLDITAVIPHTLISFGLLNLGSVFLFKWTKNLSLIYVSVSILAFITTTLVTLYSGGITSPFVFVLALLVVMGYASTNRFGAISLVIVTPTLLAIYFLGGQDKSFVTNVVPPSSRNEFALISILFATYFLGIIFGKYMLNAHYRLYSRNTDALKKVQQGETMLKEVHHRVKNNLQTVSSLLNLQSRNIEEERIKNILKSSQNRVISMSMVHEMLYMRKDISKIEFRNYVKELTEYLVRSFKGAKNNILLHIDVPDITLNVDTAIPLGLLINEIVTNALKYGIKGDEQGQIHIELKKVAKDSFMLNIGDDGIGCPLDKDPKTTKSLGLKLIHNLARQLRGSVVRDTDKKGTHYLIEFREISQEMPSSLA